MSSIIHKAKQHRSTVPGVEAMTLVSNHHFPRHAHDQFGFGIIDFGAQRSWSGVGQIEASAGDVIFCNPGEMHDGLPFERRVRVWRIIYFDPALIRRTVEGQVSAEFEIVRPVARDPLLAQHFVRLFASLTDKQPDVLGQEENLIRAIACILQRNGSCRPSYRNVKSGPSPSVTKALRRLDAAPDQPVSIADLAALSGTSRFQLIRAFRRETGTTPHAYLIQKRVSAARRLLATGIMPAEAAVAAGFSDQSHMTRAFLRHLGVTPARYRAALV
jgi:AraC-like DNA-binding protein